MIIWLFQGIPDRQVQASVHSVGAHSFRGPPCSAVPASLRRRQFRGAQDTWPEPGCTDWPGLKGELEVGEEEGRPPAFWGVDLGVPSFGRGAQHKKGTGKRHWGV